MPATPAPGGHGEAVSLEEGAHLRGVSREIGCVRTSRLEESTASSKAVRPSASRQLRLAPLNASCTAVSRCPLSTASITGVRPRESFTFTSAPLESSWRAASVCPAAAVQLSCSTPEGAAVLELAIVAAIAMRLAERRWHSEFCCLG